MREASANFRITPFPTLATIRSLGENRCVGRQFTLAVSPSTTQPHRGQTSLRRKCIGVPADRCPFSTYLRFSHSFCAAAVLFDRLSARLLAAMLDRRTA